VRLSQPFALNPTKVLTFCDAVLTRQQGWSSLGRKFGATFAPACSKDCPTSTRAHPQPKTMHFGTTTVVGLKSPLAHDDILLVTDPADTG